MSVLAVDLGSSSARLMLVNNDLSFKELARFSHSPVMINGVLKWDIPNLFTSIKNAIDLAIDTYTVKSIGICSWGVDYCQIKNGDIIQPNCYRDTKNIKAYNAYHQNKNIEYVYQKTGIFPNPINTFYQLIADKNNIVGDKILLIADAFAYYLCKNAFCERTNASTSQLLGLDGEWNYELINELELDKSFFPPIIDAGEIYGTYRGVDIVAVCSHDTASAVLSTKIKVDENKLFVSSGSWILMGALLSKPVISKHAFDCGYTNERGYNNNITLLKNTNGLYIIQRLVAELSLNYKDIDNAMNSAKSLGLIDISDLQYESITDNMLKQLGLTSANPYDLIKTAYDSLAITLTNQIKELESITNMKFNSCVMTGGMTKAPYLLSRFKECGIEVNISSSEGAVIGNAMAQLNIKN